MSSSRRSVGSPTPRFGTATPADRPSLGGAVAEVAALLGVGLLPWQRHVVDVAHQHDGSGRYLFRDVMVSTPRQSGKTTLTLAVAVTRMLTEGQQVGYLAATRLAGRRKLLDSWWPLIVGSPLRSRFMVMRGAGMESLRCSNGSTLVLLSPEPSSGHGESFDLVLVDECWSLPASVEQSLRPTMAARPRAQSWLLSTAGDATSTWWRTKVDAGRQATLDGADRGLAYFEWSAGDDVDVTDRARWAEWMPGLGHHIDPETIAADQVVMPPAEWQRAYGNQWVDELTSEWALFDEDATKRMLV
jgi:phage terminase large subunit-like protein